MVCAKCPAWTGEKCSLNVPEADTWKDSEHERHCRHTVPWLQVRLRMPRKPKLLNATPLCGECAYFRKDEQRTLTYEEGLYRYSSVRMGTCKQDGSKRDRCQYGCEQFEKPGRKDHPVSTLRRVQCVETGEIYPSRRQAGIAIGIKANSGVGYALLNPKHTCKGLHWRYVD